MTTELKNDEELFITSLALEVLGGITFNIYGQKKGFLQLFEEKEMDEAAFVAKMEKEIDIAYKTEISICNQRRQKFLVKYPEKKFESLMKKFYELEELRVSADCKKLLDEIQTLQKEFKGLQRMKTITGNLEAISNSYWSKHPSPTTEE